MHGTDRMDDWISDIFCGIDCSAEKQGEYGVAFFDTKCVRRHFNLWHESIFFHAKYCFYYSAEPTYNFDMRIPWNSGGFTAFLRSNFEHDIEISQK